MNHPCQDAQSFLGKMVTVTVDRPLGSVHPEWGFVYPVNYGCVPNVKGLDNEDLDTYVLGVFEPVKEFTGICIAVISRIDDEDNLVLVPPGKEYTDDQIRALTEFQERFFTSVIARTQIT